MKNKAGPEAGPRLPNKKGAFRMEEQKKSRKPLLVGVIAAVVVLAALLALLLTQCVGGVGPDNTSGDSSSTAQSYELYWNVDRNNFEIFEDESGQAAGTTARKPAEDGFYHVVFAKDGELVELRVKERRVLNIIDAFDIMGLVFDENGDIIDVLRLDDLPLEKKAWQYYIQSFGGNAVKFNSSRDLNGMEEMIKINENTKIYDMSGYSEFVGAPAKLQKFDRAMVIANELGEISHIFIYERDGIERTEVRFCKHCNEEVTWHNWLKKDVLPTTGGHYFLENDISTAKQNTIMDDQKVCLDLNGHTVYSKSVARMYSTFYAASSLAVMDNTENPGKFIYEGQGCDQGAILWARYGNIDIYDVTLDASKGTSHSGGLCLATEDKTVVVMHSGTMIGGKTVVVKGKSNGQAGGTVKIGGNFIMESGLITGGTALMGGNVYVFGNGDFTMNGGKITNGSARGANGGNVYVSGYTTVFTMNGGSITGGRVYRNEKGQNGAGANLYMNGKVTINSGTIANGKAFYYDGTPVKSDNRLNIFNVNGRLYLYGGTVKGYVLSLDTDVKDKYPATVHVSGSAKVKGGEPTMNLVMGNGAIFTVGKLRGSAEIYINAAGKFSNKTVESNVNYVHSDIPGAQVVYYEECLGLGRMQCVCGAHVVGVKEGEGIVHKGECDGSLTLWGAWDAVAKSAFPSQGGYYYLTSSGNVNNSMYVDAEDIYLDLNGQSVTVTGTFRAFVFITSESVHAPGKPEHNIVYKEIEGSLTLSDSVGTGTIKMPEATGSQAMLFWNWLDTVKNPKLTIYGGTYDASQHSTANYGAVAMGQNALINMYGGTIVGGKTANQGAAVYLAQGSTLNMYGDATITGGTTVGHGGNVYAESDTTINMYNDSKIVNGRSPSNGGGNIYTNGTLSLQDNASIMDGTSLGGKTAAHADIFGVNAKVFVNGGYIGYVSMTSTINDTVRFVVSNNAKVAAVQMGTYGKEATVRPIVEIAGVLADDAMIVMSGYGGIFSAETVKENADNFGSTDGQPVNFDEATKKLRVGGKFMCVCGAATSESETDNVSHKLGCDKTVYFWLPLPGTAIPESGNYYLTSSKDLGATVTFGSGSDNKGEVIRLDMNGFDMVKDNGIRRMLQIWNDTTVWLTNSKETGGRIAGYGWADKATEHSAIMQMAGTGTLNIIGDITMEQLYSDKYVLGSAGVLNTGSGVVNMYGGKLIGGKVTGNGAVVIISSKNAQFNMYGGEIVGGIAEGGSGSAIFMTAGSLTIKDATVGGGKVKHGDGVGGAIYATSGKVTLENATITGADNSKRGGAVYLAGEVTATMTGGSITAVKNPTSDITAGAALYVDMGADFTLNSGVVSAEGISTTFGAAVLVEARSNASSTTTFTMKGGKIVGGTANGYSGIGGGAVLLVNNDTTDKVIFDMQGGEITGGTAKNNAGGGVYVLAGTVFKVSGDAKITGNAGGNLVLASGVTVDVGTMGENALIGVTADDGVITKTPNPNYVNAAQYFHSDLGESQVVFMGSDAEAGLQNHLCMQYGTVTHCVCGASMNGGEHTYGCNGEILSWEPFTYIMVQDHKNIKEAGNYYLTENVTSLGWQPLLINYQGTDGAVIRIDMNGYDILGNTGLAIQTWAKPVFWLTNTSDKGGFVKGSTANNVGALQLAEITEFNMIGNVTIQHNGRFQANNGGVMNGIGTVNIYDGVIDGSLAKMRGVGGAIYIQPGAIVNIHGGNIIGGTATQGGAIYNEGTLQITGGTIVGGTATRGGAIHNEGTVLLKNASFTGGTAERGTAICNNGTLTLQGNISMSNGAELFNAGGKYVTIDGVLTGNLALDMFVPGGRISQNKADAANASLITVNGVSNLVQKNSSGYLYVPVDTGTTMLVGYGEGSLNPTAQQLDFTQKGYLDEYGRSPLPLMGYGTNAPGMTIGDGTNGAEIDNLRATAVAYIDNQGDTIIMISVDSTYVSSGVSQSIRNTIALETGVPADNILISCTHAHSTPSQVETTVFYEGTYKEGDTRTVNETDNYGNGSLVYVDGEDDQGNPVKVLVEKGILDESYFTTFSKGVVAAAKAAIEDRAKVTTLSTATVANANASNPNGKIFNEVRNYEVYEKGKITGRESIIGMQTPNHISFKNPGILYDMVYKPESAVDSSLQLVKYVRETGSDIIVTNFQTHPHVNGGYVDTDITADVVGAYRYALGNATGAKVLYFSGAGGNVDPRAGHGDNVSKCYTKEQYNMWGEDLAALAKNASYAVQTNYSTDVDAVAKSVTVTNMQETGFGSKSLEDRLNLAKTIVASGVVGSLESKYPDADTEYGIYSSYHASKIVERYNNVNVGGNYTGAIKIFAYQAGPIAFVAAPYEMYDTNGMELKAGTVGKENYAAEVQQENAFEMTVVTTMSNGALAYIPSALGYSNGGYSTDLTPYAAGTGELLVTEYLYLLNGMAD